LLVEDNSRQKLAAAYMPLARSLSRRLKAMLPWAWEEFESAACMALVEAAESFDLGRNVKFATFARRRISGALLDTQRKLLEGGRRCHFVTAGKTEFSPRNTFEEGGAQILGIKPEPPVGLELERRDLVEAWLNRLPRKHAATCRQLYLEGLTQTEAAERLGYSQSRLSSMHQEALEMLREARRFHEDEEDALAA
jgi:RNA polymerase sigma factor (sigma-70 family)